MEIVSTMGAGSLGRELDLETLVAELEDHLDVPVEANFSSNGMVTIRLEEDGPAYTMYRTGSFQIRGARSEDHLSESENQFRNVLSFIGVEVPGYEFNHVTSVFMADIDQEVNLEALTIALGMENTEYEPEQFPGLIYRPSGLGTTLLVFSSGKVIIGGTTDRDVASDAIDNLQDNLTTISGV